MHHSNNRTLVHISAAEAPYHKALQEAVARKLASIGLDRLEVILPDRQVAKNADFSPEAVHPHASNLQLHLLPAVSFKKRHGNFFPNLRLWPLLKRLNPAVIWCHEYSLFNWPALIFARLKRRPLIISTEVGQSNLPDMALSARITRRLFGSGLSGIIANSPAAMQTCENVPSDRIAQAWHSSPAPGNLPLSQANFDDTGRLRVVFVGQMIPRKGIDLLLRAVALAEREGRRFRVTFIGKPTNWSDQTLSQYAGESTVIRAGFLEKELLTSALADQDVFVLPSRYDTYGAVAHEAASAGLALIISKNAGSRQLLAGTAASNQIVNPENDEEFAGTLSSFFDLSILQHSKALSLAIAQRFSVESNADRVAQLLQNILYEHA